jgi:hypothetical protein
MDEGFLGKRNQSIAQKSGNGFFANCDETTRILCGRFVASLFQPAPSQRGYTCGQGLQSAKPPLPTSGGCLRFGNRCGSIIAPMSLLIAHAGTPDLRADLLRSMIVCGCALALILAGNATPF